MNRPKRASHNQNWSNLQTGRPTACLAVAVTPEAGPLAPASAAGYLHQPSPLSAAAATPGEKGPDEK